MTPRLVVPLIALMVLAAACGASDDSDASVDAGPATDAETSTAVDVGPESPAASTSTEPSGPAEDGGIGLSGTTWVVVSYTQDDIGATVADGVEATLAFGTDGTFAVDTGCNTGSGSYALVDGTLTVDPPSLTKAGCKGAAEPVEQTMIALLDGEVTVDQVGTSLALGRRPPADRAGTFAFGPGLQLGAR